MAVERDDRPQVKTIPYAEYSYLLDCERRLDELLRWPPRPADRERLIAETIRIRDRRPWRVKLASVFRPRHLAATEVTRRRIMWALVVLCVLVVAFSPR